MRCLLKGDSINDHSIIKAQQNNMPSVTSYSRNRLWLHLIGHSHFYKLEKEFHSLVEVSRVSKQHPRMVETSGTCAMLLFTTFADPDLCTHAYWVNIDFAQLVW